MKKCTYCAEEIQDDAVFCRHCHHDLKTGEHKASSAQKVQKVQDVHKTKGKAIMLWGIIITVIGMIGSIAGSGAMGGLFVLGIVLCIVGRFME